MDKFVIRTQRTAVSKQKESNPTPIRQATIESLNGVVVIEDLLRCKAVLRVKDQNADAIVKALNELSMKMPSRNALKSTKIGHTVNRLTVHQNKDVALQAKTLLKKWKSFYEEKMDRQMIEVKCDKQTEKLRQTGRKLIAKELGSEEHTNLAEVVERECFYQHGMKSTNAYRRSMRSLIFTLKHQNSIKSAILNKTLPIKDFVCDFKKD